MIKGDEKKFYWPNGELPWTQEDRDNVGPHADLPVSEGWRGYDIAGNWLGGMLTHSLTWMLGSRNAQGQLTLGERKPGYFGDDGFIV